MVRVLQVLDVESKGLNPFVAQLLDSMVRAGAEIQLWSLKTAIVCRYDVVHVHWPERLYRNTSLFRSIGKIVFFVGLLLIWRLRHIPVVWTVHNLYPHEALSPLEQVADRFFRASVSLAVYLNDYEDSAPGLRKNVTRAVVKHGDYTNWVRQYDRHQREPRRICLFGNLRPYKGIEALISASRDLPNGYRLHILGKPYSDDYGSELIHIVGSDPMIELDMGFKSDKELVSAITKSALIVLPYKNFYNSGAVFLSLSLGRPVLLPKNDHTVLLQAEFGDNWIVLYEDDLSASDIVSALEESAAMAEESRPDLTARDWGSLGSEYIDHIKLVLGK